ncbi:unnamed protein product [Prunus armeniaca]
MGVWRMDGVICGSVNPRMCFLQCGWENDGSLEDGWSDLWKYEFEDEHRYSFIPSYFTEKEGKTALQQSRYRSSHFGDCYFGSLHVERRREKFKACHLVQTQNFKVSIMDSVDNTYYANILNGQVDLTDPLSTFGCTPTNQNEGDNDMPQVIVPAIPTTKS